MKLNVHQKILPWFWNILGTWSAPTGLFALDRRDARRITPPWNVCPAEFVNVAPRSWPPRPGRRG
jgi:hypothetical protein